MYDATSDFEENLMIKIAWYYYMEDLTQQAIANQLGISRMLSLIHIFYCVCFQAADRRSDRILHGGYCISDNNTYCTDPDQKREIFYRSG